MRIVNSKQYVALHLTLAVGRFIFLAELVRKLALMKKTSDFLHLNLVNNLQINWNMSCVAILSRQHNKDDGNKVQNKNHESVSSIL